MVNIPKTRPSMISLRRAKVYPTGVAGSSSLSLVRRRMNLRATSLASITGFLVLEAVAMASKAERAGEGVEDDGAVVVVVEAREKKFLLAAGALPRDD